MRGGAARDGIRSAARRFAALAGAMNEGVDRRRGEAAEGPIDPGAATRVLRSEPNGVFPAER